MEGTYKKFKEDDILHNYIVTTPHTNYHSGSEIFSGSIMLYEEPFEDDGTAVVYEGYEEGDVRAFIEKTNKSGVINLSHISASSSGTEKGLYSLVVQLTSGSRPYYNAHIDAITDPINDDIVIFDYTSVFYDRKIKDCVICLISGNTKEYSEGKHIIDGPTYRYSTADFAVGGQYDVDSIILYHDHSGALKIGMDKYLYQDDEGDWRYNISASKGDSSTVYIVDGWDDIQEVPETNQFDNNTTVGYLLPEHGLGFINNSDMIDGYKWWNVSGSKLFFNSFDGHNEIPVSTYLCHADRGELNLSNNPTYYKSGSQGEQYHSGTHTTYITKVGLYNKERRLVAVASLAQPIRHKPNEKVMFKLTHHR